MNAKYLRVTIHDNDFISSLIEIGKLLYYIFYMEDKYPTEEQFPELAESIKHLLYGANMTKDLARWGEIIKVDIEYFKPKLEFVDYLDIPDWDNHENIYIPMFDCEEMEILVR